MSATLFGRLTPLVDRLMSKVTPEPNTGCWLWTGSTSADGYGRVLHREVGFKPATHLAWRVEHGHWPDGLQVLHRCDNPTCVNPDHLFLGTISDNMRDMVTKGRGRNAQSQKTHCPKGHPYAGTNLLVVKGKKPGSTSRHCRECTNERHRAARLALHRPTPNQAKDCGACTDSDACGGCPK